MSAAYWTIVGDEVKGPFRLDELLHFEACGNLAGEAMIKPSDQPDWITWNAVKAAARPLPVAILNDLPILNRGIYILLALVLGSVGMHNLYARHFGRGIVQIILLAVSVSLVFGSTAPWLALATGIPLVIWILGEIALQTRDGEKRFMV